MFSAIRGGFVYVPSCLKTLGAVTVPQLMSQGDDKIQTTGQIQIQTLPKIENKHYYLPNTTVKLEPKTTTTTTTANMTKMTLSEVSDATSCASDTEATTPITQAAYYFLSNSYMSLPTVDGVLDLSATSPILENKTIIGRTESKRKQVALTPNTFSALVEDLSSSSMFTMAPSFKGKRVSSTSVSSENDLASDILGDGDNVEVDSDILDPTVAQAAYEAAQSGLLTPLVKEELRCTIQSKRLKTGKEELVVDDHRPCTPELTPEDKLKQERRRDRNKIAAQKCRNKRKTKMDSLEDETHELETNNRKLQRQIKELQLERDKLTLLLRCHDTSSHTCPQNRTLSESTEERLSKMLQEISQGSDSIADSESTYDGYEEESRAVHDDNGELYADQEIEIIQLSFFDEEVVISANQ